jgi:Abnormal spindle-like microcephaly-assoc'd, ASPM-SPD-2-Hydin/Beta-propeller repeat
VPRVVSTGLYRFLLPICLCILILCPSLGAAAPKTGPVSLPVVFEENQGQVAPEFKFLNRSNGLETLYGSSGIHMRLADKTGRVTEIRMRWLHAGRPSMVAEKPLPGQSNYLLGSDPSRWIKGVPQSAQIRYRQLYPGIDLVFHGTGDSIEHDFEVQAGANPAKIAFSLDQPVVVANDQSLQVEAGGHTLHFAKPIAYQQYGHERKQIRVAFLVSPEGIVTFRLGKYDPSKTLVIDPVLTFSTYFTGTATDTIRAIATDAGGNVYVTGGTTATDFPLKNPEQSTCSHCANSDADVFVSKLDPTGQTLLYSTYLGGASGAEGGSIAVDGQGNIVVSGTATGGDFPHTPAAPPECITTASCFFLTSLKPDGASFNYSILLGGAHDEPGSGNDGHLALDSAGNAYFAGNTNDPNFPTTPGTLSSSVSGYPNTALVVLKMGTTGTLTYSTAIPGNAPANPQNSYTNLFQVEGIAVDANGQVTVAGTSGPGLPTTAATLQASFPVTTTGDGIAGFVLQLNSTATALNYATYLPGTDYATGLAVAGDGSLYIAGSTAETNLPVSENAYMKALLACPDVNCNAGYIMKLDSSAKTVVAATYLEGTDPTQNGGGSLQGISLDSHSNPVVGGFTSSTAFPLVNPFVSQFETSSSYDSLVIAQMSSDLSTLLFSSFLSSTSAYPYTGSFFNVLAVDPNDRVIVAGTTYAANFPTTPGSFEPQLPLQPNEGQNTYHAFLASLNLATPAPSVCLSSWQVNFGLVPALSTTSQSLTLTNCGNAPLHLTSYTSSFPSFGATGTCADVTPGSTCTIQVSFSPANSTALSATITLTDDAAIPTQTVAISGQGLAADLVPYPTSLNMGRLLVGTQGAVVQLILQNQGTAPLVVSALSISGDFSIAGNGCTTPMAASTGCPVSLQFTPTAEGARTGSLTITSNDPVNPQLTVPLSGVGDSAYAAPAITSISPQAVLVGVAGQQLQVAGTNFYPASVVRINGKAQATTFVSNTQLTATIDGPSVAAIGEEPVTAFTPTPGGGESNSVPLTPYQTLAINPSSLISVPATGMLYASIPASSVTNPNTIVPIDPATGKAGTPIPVGNDPRSIAASGDGKYLYVALYGDLTIQRINLQTSTVERTFPFPTVPSFSSSPLTVSDMHVVPGENQSLVVAFINIIALYNDGGLVNVIPGSYPGLDVTSFTFLNNPNTFYSLPLDFRSNAPEVYTIGTAGLETTVPTLTVSGINGNGGFALATDGTLLFTSNGSVWDPATPKLLGTFQLSIYNVNSAGDETSLTADAGPGQVYFLGDQPYGNDSTALMLSAFDKASFKLIGALPFEQVTFPIVFNLVRWGTNGFGFIASGSGLTDQEVYILSSSLATAAPNNPLPTVSAISPTSAVSGAAAFPLTVNGSGFIASSVVEWNGAPLTTNYVSGTQLTAAVTAADVAAAGGALVTVQTPAPGGGTSVDVGFTIAAAPGQLSLSPATIAFGNESVATPSPAQTVILTNTGGQPISLTSIAASSQFSETNNCGSTLSPAASCKVSVIFTPSASGPQTGTLTLTDDAMSSPQAVTLSGTGVGSALTIAPGSGGSTGATITAGQSATYNLSLTGSPGLTGAVTITCSGAPTGSVCSVTPSSLNLASGQSSNFTVTVNTAPSGNLAPSERAAIAGCVWLCSLAMIPFLGTAKRVRALLVTFSLLVACAAATGLSGCGGGQSSSTTTTGGSQVTPGSYSLHVSATEGSVTATQTLSLTVQ